MRCEGWFFFCPWPLVSMFFYIKGTLNSLWTGHVERWNKWKANKQTKKKMKRKKKTPALGRVGYGCTGASSPSTFRWITRGFTQIAKIWLSYSELETQHLLAERKRAMVPTEVSEPGRWAWHLRKQAGLDLWSPTPTPPPQIKSFHMKKKTNKKPVFPELAGGIFTTEPSEKPLSLLLAYMISIHLCITVTVCYSMSLNLSFLMLPRAWIQGLILVGTEVVPVLAAARCCVCSVTDGTNSWLRSVCQVSPPMGVFVSNY